MITWFLTSKIGQWIVAGLGIAATVLFAAWRLFSAGKEAARVDGLESQVQNVDAANQAKREVTDAAASGTVPDGVRKFYADK